jgi:superfamily II DNA or RNA helicase
MTAQAGTFDYIEAKIRAEARGTEFGRDFEWLCKWYLENAAIYRGQFRKVWRWGDWPDRWGRDCGIDLIAETHDGEVYAIQCKAVSQEHTVTKAEIDSFLSESNRREIDYRLLIATTDNIGANAMRTIENQAVHASVVLRGDLVSVELEWPTEIGSAAPRPQRWKPKPHQKAAIKDVVAGFKKHDRGRLIMACGTGKTLTGLWINEAIKSRRTLLLVPSISLVQQNLKEWGRHAKEDFDYLVVCSDETVGSDRDDPAMRYIADLGVKPTTDAKQIAEFLAKRRSRPALVISTYQSCDRVAKGQAKAKKKFDLTICDEAHRLVGHVDSHFATVLDDRKIRSHRRLFMTATPRYFTQRAKERGAEQDIELVSMDDESLFGPEFHVLNFHDAITATPDPLLTDYQVVVIGVTDAEAKAWVADAKLVRTKGGLETDARTLAAQIGLAKAVKQYNLTRMITFHRSIRRASRFVDETKRDSLPAVIEKLRPASRPSGRLWARHVSGETPASKRASLVKELGELPSGVRGLISNCACLGEGVDVPALDGIAFIDPKGSVVDIIQAVGRVIRRSPDKKAGTIIIPVFVDESEDADHALEGSAFQPVWQVLKALRAHDRRLADELDQLRTSLGRQSTPGQRIKLPANVVLDVPRLLLTDFEQAFYVRAVMATTERPRRAIEQVLEWADAHKKRTGSWPSKTSGVIDEGPDTWSAVDAALKKRKCEPPQKSSLAQLLWEHRDVRSRSSLEPLATAQVLKWADSYFKRTGRWPTASSGAIPDSQENWSTVARALRTGNRGEGNCKSLATTLAEHRGYRSQHLLPPIKVTQILQWADEHRKSKGSWPTSASGVVRGTSETWNGISRALREGGRGLRGNSSIAILLEKHRGVRNSKQLRPLTVGEILAWLDEHKKRYGDWPTVSSGPIHGTSETWNGIQSSLLHGRRGLPSGLSIVRLLVKYRGYRSSAEPPPITVEQILKWADDYKRKTRKWPRCSSGIVPGTQEKWRNINAALISGSRGLPSDTSLAKLLAEHRGARNVADLPSLSVSQILQWVDEHKAATGEWPTIQSGAILETDELWRNVANALIHGLRGLHGGTTLTQLLTKHRGVRNPKRLPALSTNQIVRWARRFQREHGEWPRRSREAIPGTFDTWFSVDNSLRKGLRGLPGGSSLAQLLDEYCRGKE